MRFPLLLLLGAAYDMAAHLPVHLRRHIAHHLRAVVDLVESADPLIHRRHDPRLLDECVGHAQGIGLMPTVSMPTVSLLQPTFP